MVNESHHNSTGLSSASSKSDLAVPTLSSKSFAEMLSRLVMGDSKPPSTATNGVTISFEQEQQQRKKEASSLIASMQQSVVQTPSAPKRSCRPPVSKKFGHPCSCGSNHHKGQAIMLNYTSSLPPAAYTAPLHLYDPASKKCLPTSRSRDMLLKECRYNVRAEVPNLWSPQVYHGTPCAYEDLVCDTRKNRCYCKPSLHLYYERNNTAFGCVPIGPMGSADGRLNCKPGYIYNVISKECQKIFDVNELPPTFTTGVSATQFSFVTIVLIWILLLILIVTAKLRKLRSSNLYRNSPSPAERRSHRHGTLRHQNQGSASAWLHPFIAAVNGHHHLNQHRTTVDRHSQGLDDSGVFNDTDFFLANGTRRINELFPEGPFAGSQQSLNNPPPKFEEIYPSCPEEQQHINIPPPANEDLPSYDEAMKLQNTVPPDISRKD